MVLAARDALRSARYEDQHQLPLARLEILVALGADGPAAALAATGQALDRFEESGGSPRYVWPVITAGASAVLAAARPTGTDRGPHDQRLRDEAAAVAARLRTVTEKLEAYGRVQQAHQLTFAAADASAADLPPSRPLCRQASGSAALLAAWDEAAAAWAALASLIRWPGRCCPRRRPRWPAATATARRKGCGARSARRRAGRAPAQ